MATPASTSRERSRCHGSSPGVCLTAPVYNLPLRPELPFSGRASPDASPHRKCGKFGNIDPIPIDYAFLPRLRGRLTLGKIALTLETLGFRWTGIPPVFSLLMPASSLPIPPAPLAGHLLRPTECSPTHTRYQRCAVASVPCLAPLHYRRITTRPVSCYALFQGMAASKPTSWLSSQLHFLFHSAWI